ncbi:MAG: hypothetical protein H6741_32405 [Alphaproteobacteria bacterium]|nr:hypothetical protein [Alphaproteobacteria bacterium]
MLPILLALASLSSPAAWAGEADTTPVLGMAGAGAANPLDDNALRRSPASMLLLVGYTARADFRVGGGSLGGSAAIKDTRTSDFGAGLMYSYEQLSRSPDLDQLPGWVDPDAAELVDERQEHTLRLGAGYGFKRTPVMDDNGTYEVRRFALGAGVVYEYDDSSLDGVAHSVDLDLGLAGRPVIPLVLALNVHDILPTGLRPLSGELGAWYAPNEVVALGADFVYDPSFGDTPLGGRAGVELLLGGVVPLRGGYAAHGGADGGTEQSAGVGIGARSDKTSLDYALTIHTVGPLAGTLTHSFGLWARF